MKPDHYGELCSYRVSQIRLCYQGYKHSKSRCKNAFIWCMTSRMKNNNSAVGILFAWVLGCHVVGGTIMR